MIVSFINLYSVSDYEGKLFSLPMTLIFMSVGVVSSFFITAFNYRNLKKKKIYNLIYFGAIGLLLFMVIAGRVFNGLGIVREINGAYGWIRIGRIGLQPAEILKLAYIILISLVLGKSEENNKSILETFFETLKVVGPFIGLIILQNDLGTVIHYLAIYVFLLFFIKIKTKKIVGILTIFGVVGFSALAFIYKYGTAIGGYKARRIVMYVDGLLHDGYTGNIDIGYQVAQSLLAFGNGGLFGVGYGNGVQKFSYLPEIHTDFIMALFGEEMGLVGVAFIIMIFFLFYNVCIEISATSRDYFGKYLVVGIGGMVITQILINLSVAVGLLPVFGIPMPIFSYGGSSMLTIMAGVGLVLSVNNYTSLRFDK